MKRGIGNKEVVGLVEQSVDEAGRDFAYAYEQIFGRGHTWPAAGDNARHALNKCKSYLLGVVGVVDKYLEHIEDKGADG